MNVATETKVRLIASPTSWIEREAVRQLYAAAALDGARRVVGFPDLHPGRGAPVGAALVTEGLIYPHLIGDDIGCGMALFKTNLSRRCARHVDQWAGLPFNLEHPWDDFVGDFLAGHGLESTEFDAALGTIGAGNHFAELQTIERVCDPARFGRTALECDQIIMLVHSGSRGLGEAVLRDYMNEHHGYGAPAESDAAETYRRGHDFAVRWARANRELIALRFASALGATADPVWDGCHNNISGRETDGESVWIHRKGAVEADRDFVVVSGSRGALSYLVKPLCNEASHAWSLAHGAGRKWARSDTRMRMRERFGARQLTRTALGSRVICEERDLLYEEAPAAYKNIDVVIADLADAGLVSVIATFRPLLTYKTRKVRR